MVCNFGPSLVLCLLFRLCICRGCYTATAARQLLIKVEVELPESCLNTTGGVILKQALPCLQHIYLNVSNDPQGRCVMKVTSAVSNSSNGFPCDAVNMTGNATGPGSGVVRATTSEDLVNQFAYCLTMPQVCQNLLALSGAEVHVTEQDYNYYVKLTPQCYMMYQPAILAPIPISSSGKMTPWFKLGVPLAIMTVLLLLLLGQS